MCFFEEKMIFLLCPFEEMFPHFKLRMENFSYFFRWLLKINLKNVGAVGWYCYSIPNKQTAL